MDSFISNCLNYYNNNPDILDPVMAWQDMGTIINKALYDANYGQEIAHKFPNLSTLITSLKSTIEAITVTEPVICYRCRNNNNTYSIVNNFLSLATNLDAALEYGNNVEKIIISPGSHAFYLDVMRNKDIDCSDEESYEKEILLFGGKLYYEELINFDGLNIDVYTYHS
jgi:hypothetical protein